MKSCAKNIIRSKVNIEPIFRLVDLFEESTEYERNWKLPFNSLCLCVQENPADPSWVELPEKNIRFNYEENVCHFVTCDTPMRIRFTTANRHLCIHFRYELIPGVDLFSGIHQRYIINNKRLSGKIKSVFKEPDPLRRLARAEAVTTEMFLDYWPENLPLNLQEMAEFSDLFQYVRNNLDSQMGIADLAGRMGWSDAYFSRRFKTVFHITPKQYLVRELFARTIQLLNDSSKSIKEIAYELGFSSEFNFSRFVTRYSGHAPSKLRMKSFGPLYVRK